MGRSEPRNTPSPPLAGRGVVASDTTSTGRAGRLPLTPNPRYARLPTSPVDPVRTAGSDEESGSHVTQRWRETDSNFRFRREGTGFRALVCCVNSLPFRSVHTSLLGPDALLTCDDSPMNGLLAEILVSVPATSIAGGTDEIQRNIISERVLNMPRERTGDADKPFKDVPRNTVA